MTRREDGFTLVEVLAAMVVSLSAVFAASGLLMSGTQNARGHQHQAALTAIAQREAEALQRRARSQGITAVATTSMPAPGASASDAADPASFVTSDGHLRVMADYRKPTETPIAREPLLSSATGVPAVTTGVVSGRARGTVHRFVSSVATPCPAGTDCAGEVRRVVIAVVPQQSSTTRAAPKMPVFFTTQVAVDVPARVRSSAGGITLGLNVP